MELLVGAGLAGIAVFGLLSRWSGPRSPVRRMGAPGRRVPHNGFDPRRLGIGPTRPDPARGTATVRLRADEDGAAPRATPPAA